MDRKEVFTKGYEVNMFRGKESKSGPGSDLNNTIILREKLIKFLNEYNIKTFIDAPCGDFNYMKLVIPKTNIEKYIGVDIVSEMIKNNNKLYSNEKISFVCLDMVEDFNLCGDLVLCRDCLVHVSLNSARQIIKNIVNSGSKYVLFTVFSDNYDGNHDYIDGTNWYAIDLTKPPFEFPKSEYIINEECPEWDGKYKDKSLALWKTEDLKSICGTW